MTWLSYLGNADAVFVADTSVLINLNASGRSADILGSFPCRFAVPDNVAVELENGRSNGHSDADMFDALCNAGHVDRVALGKVALGIYESLIDGSTLRTLDDGEAATLGCAVEHSAIALIDERKARLLCSDMYPELTVVSSAELLTSDPILHLLGQQGQIDALHNALRIARMRVPKELVDKVVEIIGPEAAASCTSLPRPKASKAQ